MNNSRYTVALHILSILVMSPDASITSDYIAQSVNTNPVVIRRILATLRKAGMVISQTGFGGGIQLNQAPEYITLLDVHRLFKKDDLFPMHTNQPNQTCPCGSNIQAVLGLVYGDAQDAMEAVLQQKTVADIVSEIWQKYYEKTSE